jgi:hypothetical protein
LIDIIAFPLGQADVDNVAISCIPPEWRPHPSLLPFQAMLSHDFSQEHYRHTPGNGEQAVWHPTKIVTIVHAVQAKLNIKVK